MTVEIVKGRKYIERTGGEVVVALVDGTDKNGDGAFEGDSGWCVLDTATLVPGLDEVWRNLYENSGPGAWYPSRKACDVLSASFGERFAVQHRLPDGTMKFECVDGVS